MKYLFLAIGIVSALTTSHSAHAKKLQYDRQMDRQQPHRPEPDATFSRLVTGPLGYHDDCFPWEAREFQRDVRMRKARVICRSKCPPGYGTNETHCVYMESFQPYTRVLNFRKKNDHCMNFTDPYDEAPEKLVLQTELIETKSILKVNRQKRTACTAICPPSLYIQDKNGRCTYKESYEPKETKAKCGLFGKNCRCPENYSLFPGTKTCVENCGEATGILPWGSNYIRQPNERVCVWQTDAMKAMNPSAAPPSPKPNGGGNQVSSGLYQTLTILLVLSQVVF